MRWRLPLLTKRTPGVAGVVGSGATGRRPRPRAAPPAARFVGDFGEDPLSPVDEEDASDRSRKLRRLSRPGSGL